MLSQVPPDTVSPDGGDDEHKGQDPPTGDIAYDEADDEAHPDDPQDDVDAELDDGVPECSMPSALLLGSADHGAPWA